MTDVAVKKKRIASAVYILPNLLTTGNLFFGFYSIVKSLNGKFELAAVAILLAGIFDLLDGRVARLTKGTSNFGVQYDSLCDLVSFGLAPAFLMYQYGLHTLGRVGWIACFLFLACGALRLARFNVQSALGKASGDFVGLPIPMAAGVLACFVALLEDLSEWAVTGSWLQDLIVSLAKNERLRVAVMIIVGPLLAFGMVSNLPYRSHKAIRIRGIKSFRLLVLFVLVTALVAVEPQLLGFALFLAYALSGPFEWLVGWKKALDEREIFLDADEQESIMDEGEEGDEAGPGTNDGSTNPKQV